MAASLLDQLQLRFTEEIPITQHMGIAVDSYDGDQLRLTMPLQPNLNHKLTAFGGSINALTTLAGWGLVWLILKENDIEGHHIVIQDGHTQYYEPVVSETIYAVAPKPSERRIEALVQMYARKRKARLKLYSFIYQDGEPVVQFNGRFVTMERKNS
ncbi:MAG: thioesterase domain-containing protein [Bacteroidota bacterium]